MLGASEGRSDGEEEGILLGDIEGASDGIRVGCCDGVLLGALDGALDGWLRWSVSKATAVGIGDGRSVGVSLCSNEGESVG